MNKSTLIGYTGFVGSNLLLSKKFDRLYNSKNISDISKENHGLLICSGVSGTKFLANKYPEKDLERIQTLIDNLKKIEQVEKFVLISSVDVYPDVSCGDENTSIQQEEIPHSYGKNRLYMEEFVKEYFEKPLIVRLPAIYGENLKKNFIFDMIYKIPFLLKTDIFSEISDLLSEEKKQLLSSNYHPDVNGNHVLDERVLASSELIVGLRKLFEGARFSVHQFTDYRSTYQFYHLKNLWDDIETALLHNLDILNIAPHPLSVAEAASECFGEEFTNKMKDEDVISYDIHSIHGNLYKGKDGYIHDRNTVIQELKNYIKKRDI